jgi:transmembrane sensor
MAPNRELRALGQVLSELQDRVLAARERPGVTDRLAAIYQARAQQALTRRLMSRSSALALVAVAAALLIALSFRPRPLGFVVGPTDAPGKIGVWVAAPDPELKPLEFSDGSRVVLQSGAQARVVSTNEHGARIVVERGTLSTDVVPRPNNEWFVVGGPFEIRVTGTSFDASWEPELQRLHVAMREGHVVIRADCLETSRALSKGESLTLSCAAEDTSKTVDPLPPVPAVTARAAALPAQPSPRTPNSAVSDAQSTALSPPVASPRTLPSAASTPNSWREFARLGDYPAALSAADRSGFDDLCETLSASILLELATTARLARSLPQATAAYLAIRRRFPGSKTAASAAFHLGQLAFDGLGAWADAQHWFATYLIERPAGGLAAEALGRRMEAEQRSGDLGAARASAASYLERFPAGAHARLAKSLQEP